MVKPSLLQTLLRQPSQSYSDRSPSRPSSIRSVSSRSSLSASTETRTLDRAPDGSWEWSTFGGRKGLTGGPASLRAPSDVVRAGRGEDARSVRSAKSASSLGSGRKKDKDGPSRRYSDMPTDPATSDVSTKRRTVHHTTSEPDLAAPKRQAHLRDPNTPPVPSLSSSPSSSAFSSPPLTPASSVVSTAKKRRTKQERLDRVDEGVEDPDVYFSAHESSPESVRAESPRKLVTPVVSRFEQTSVQFAPSPLSALLASPTLVPTPLSPPRGPVLPAEVMGRSFTMDELFAASSVPQPFSDADALVPLKTTACSHTPHESTSSSSSDSSTTASSPTTDLSLSLAPKATIPVIRLTRTSSDQQVAGVLYPPPPSLSSPSSSPSSSPPLQTNRSGSITSLASSSTRPALPRKSSRRGSTPALTQTYEVVKTSQSQRLTSANLDATSAAADTPQWLRGVRALGEPIAPLVVGRSKSTSAARAKPDRSLSFVDPSSNSSVTESASPLRHTSSANVLEPNTTPSSTASPRRRTQSAKSPEKELRRASTLSSPPVTSSPRRRAHSVDFAPFATPVLRSFDAPVSPSSVAPPILFTPSEQTSRQPTLFDPSPAPRRAHSVLSATPSAVSLSGLSTMSVPNRPTKLPRLPLPSLTSSGTMLALSLTSNPAPPRFSRASPSTSRALTFHFGPTTPPSKIRDSQVLVQVLAVGLDLWDLERAKDRAGSPDGFGWVPGRSFCGKVIECGAAASSVRRGEFVYGCLEVAKSGALAERIVVERNLLGRAPAGQISAEEIAALPAAGVLAVQVMEALCASLPRGSKVLILNAHEGVGALALQLARHLRPQGDLWLVAQCPPEVVDGERYCRSLGASDVLREEPLATLNAVHESSFDVVVDTIGGRRLYDAARRILHFEGRFITTVGDSRAAPTAGILWKANMRSLRRAFFPKDKKTISYWAVNLDSRELPRDALERLRDAVEVGGVRPAVRNVVAFDQAGEAFRGDLGGGTVVRVGEM